MRTFVQLFGPSQLREAVRARPATGTRGVALRCGTSLALALLVCGMTGSETVAGFAALGSLASLYGRKPGYRYRVSVTLLAGLSLLATTVVTSVIAASESVATLVPLVIAAIATLASWACDALEQGPPGAMIPVFAAGAAAVPVAGMDQLHARIAATATGVLVAVAVASVAAVWHHVQGLGPAPSGAVLPTALDRPAAVTSALVIGAGAALAGLAANTVGWGHPAWASLGAVAVLQGAHLQLMGVRAVQRGLGTVAGALLAYPLLTLGLGFWGTAAVVVALQVLTELVVARHYGLAMLTITPMALLMVSLASPAAPGALALDRSADTVLGVLIGLGVAVLSAHPEAISGVGVGDRRGVSPRPLRAG